MQRKKIYSSNIYIEREVHTHVGAHACKHAYLSSSISHICFLSLPSHLPLSLSPHPCFSPCNCFCGRIDCSCSKLIGVVSKLIDFMPKLFAFFPRLIDLLSKLIDLRLWFNASYTQQRCARFHMLLNDMCPPKHCASRRVGIGFEFDEYVYVAASGCTSGFQLVLATAVHNFDLSNYSVDCSCQLGPLNQTDSSW